MSVTPRNLIEMAALAIYDDGERRHRIIAKRLGMAQINVARLLRRYGRQPDLMRSGRPSVATWCPADQVRTYQRLRKVIGAAKARAAVERGLLT